MGSKSARLRKRQEARRREDARRRQEERKASEASRLARLEESYSKSSSDASSASGNVGHSDGDVIDLDVESVWMAGAPSSTKGKAGRDADYADDGEAMDRSKPRRSRRADRHRRNADLIHGMAESVRDLKKDDDSGIGKDASRTDVGSSKGGRIWTKTVAIVAVVGMLATGGVVGLAFML